MKGESSPSTARLYLPINVMPFPHLISLCDHQSHRTVTAPVFPIRKHSRHRQILKCFLGWTPGIWIGPVMVESTLMPACFLKKTVLLHDDCSNSYLQIRKEPQSLLTCLTPCEQGRPILFLLLFPENQLYPLPQGFKFKPNGILTEMDLMISAQPPTPGQPTHVIKSDEI